MQLKISNDSISLILKTFSQAFDNKFKQRKIAYRTVQHIISLAKTRGYQNNDKLYEALTKAPHDKMILLQILHELFEFVSQDEMAQLIHGFRQEQFA